MNTAEMNKLKAKLTISHKDNVTKIYSSLVSIKAICDSSESYEELMEIYQTSHDLYNRCSKMYNGILCSMDHFGLGEFRKVYGELCLAFLDLQKHALRKSEEVKVNEIQCMLDTIKSVM